MHLCDICPCVLSVHEDEARVQVTGDGGQRSDRRLLSLALVSHSLPPHGFVRFFVVNACVEERRLAWRAEIGRAHV